MISTVSTHHYQVVTTYVSDETGVRMFLDWETQSWLPLPDALMQDLQPLEQELQADGYDAYSAGLDDAAAGGSPSTEYYVHPLTGQHYQWCMADARQ